MTVYGPSVESYDVEDAVRETIRTWIDSYLLDQERKSNGRWGLRQIQRPKSFQLVSDYTADTADRRLPCIAVESAEEALEPAAQGQVNGEWGLNVIVLAKGRQRDETRNTVSAYIAALKLLLFQKGDLDEFADGVLVGGATYDAVPATKAKTVAGARMRIAVTVPNVATRFGGPEDPEPAPPTAPDPDSPEYPAHTATHITVTELED